MKFLYRKIGGNSSDTYLHGLMRCFYFERCVGSSTRYVNFRDSTHTTSKEVMTFLQVRKRL